MGKHSKGKKDGGLVAVTRKINQQMLLDMQETQSNTKDTQKQGKSKPPNAKRKGDMDMAGNSKKARIEENLETGDSIMEPLKEEKEHFKLTREAIMDELNALLGNLDWNAGAILDSIVAVCAEEEESVWKQLLNPQVNKGEKFTQTYVLKLGRKYIELTSKPNDANFGKKIVSILRRTKGAFGAVSAFIFKLLELKTPSRKPDHVFAILGEEICKAAQKHAIDSKLGALWKTPLIVEEPWKHIKGWISLSQDEAEENDAPNPNIFREVIERYQKLITPYEARKLNLIELRQAELALQEAEKAVEDLKLKIEGCKQKETDMKMEFETSKVEKALVSALKGFSSDATLQISFAEAVMSLTFPSDCANGATYFSQLVERTYDQVYHKI